MTIRKPKNDTHCIQLSSGHYYNPFDFAVTDVRVADIASVLSKLCRFNGQCSAFYSVAQHSVHVAERVFALSFNLQYARAALFHDASEAYIGDMVTPMKRHFSMETYRAAEDHIQTCINRKLVLDAANVQAYNDLLRRADLELLSAEAALFMPGGGREWGWANGRPDFSRPIPPLSWKDARTFFDNYHYELQEQIAHES